MAMEFLYGKHHLSNQNAKTMKQFILPFLILLICTAFRISAEETMTITGKVTDTATGQGLAGVSIFAGMPPKGAGHTKPDGTYKIAVPAGTKRLIFSYVGYQPRTLEINGIVINVALSASKNTMNETVIRGYQKRTGNPFAAIATGTLDVPVANVEQLLQGKVAGLNLQNNESYTGVNENSFKTALTHPLSTFSVDVDAASYSNLRRFINNGGLPPVDAVRIEEMVNYFDYEYPQPKGNDPVSICTEVSDAPWNTRHKLVRIGLQGKKVPTDRLPASNLVFLIDVSGSMNDYNKLPLLVSSFKMLTGQLRREDRVAIVVYAGNAGLVLPSTPGNEKMQIKDALNRLSAGGSTAGGQGIELAYEVAAQHFIKEGNNRVILATDGDFNVGASSDRDMEQLIENKRKSGIFLTVLGFGMGNYKDSKMEVLADKGNGNYAYIDNISEARKVLVNEFGGTLFTIAKDVKLQVEFNPAKVQAYRLVGYENRMLKARDFNDDTKDAGEMGAGHTVTAFYEVIPAGVKSSFSGSVDPLKYQQSPEKAVKLTGNPELMTVKLRYKEPDGDVSKLMQQTVADRGTSFGQASENFRFAAAVAEFGLLLKQSPFKQNASFDHVISAASAALGRDSEGYRAEFVKLARSAVIMARDLLTFEQTEKRNEKD